MRVTSKIWLAVLGLLMVTVLAAAACGGESATATPVPQVLSTDTPVPETLPTDTPVPETTPEPAEPFRIGVMESVTGPGETYGVMAVQSKQLAVEQINAAGGINGRPLEIIVEDEKCNAQDAITAYTKLTQVDGVKIILGTSCSGAMLGAAPLAEEDGVVLFSGLATNPDIAFAGDFIFRTSMSDAQLGIDTGNLLWDDGIRTLVTMTEATDYAEGVRRTSVERFETLGGEVLAEERYASDVTDFRSQLTKLIGENPDALHISAQSEFTGGTIVKQVRELGYDGPIYSEIVPVGPTALEIAGDAATGVKAIIADLDPSNVKAQEVLRDFDAKYGYVILPWYLGSAYDDVFITAECLAQTNDDQDAEGFRDCLYEITWTGTIGENYSFDANGEVVGLSNLVVEVLPTAERTQANQGYKVLGPAPVLP
jgi:branched-chain amino acid transport system substrate-binding protein